MMMMMMNMWWKWKACSNSILLLLLMLIMLLAMIDGGCGMKLELIHRNSPNNNETSTSLVERITQLYERDMVRQQHMIYRRLRHTHSHSTRRKDRETATSIAMRIRSAADYGRGEYFVRVKVGTPGQNFRLFVDTGSDLTWTKCRYHCKTTNCKSLPVRLVQGEGRLINNKRVFRADFSSTFNTIPCSSPMCKIGLSHFFSLATCRNPTDPCFYDYGYMEGSRIIGFFANETVSVNLTNGRKEKLQNVLVGCTESMEGDFRAADGVLGLGFSKYSFTAHLVEEFGAKFSYCLVDHLSPRNVSSYLLFGHVIVGTKLLSNKQYTKLILANELGSLYGVSVSDISIGGVLLKIPSQVWDVNVGGGTVLDSGTSLTYLSAQAYDLVMAALLKSVSKFQRLSVDGVPFEYCFNSTGFDESLVPRLRVHFTDGARFEPPVKSYIIDVAMETKCLGFVSSEWPAPSVIGNIMQQNHLWEFDLEQSTLGFAPSTCT
ncbi:hypothetical protein FEM48_Zijuj03G0010200 [Ziziphus jujuba var. spinosa]|uniref:Peptidase A1 domain-containing protein n=1 Tax=Ziziphus jujuba var. spinosa TaxID=714518 RepID=A0A978VMA6_ZIZJJ|nr:hypothetical protein FEM48_Zijuj03G0010200 [Ziziphus jujuba var. spinosa]